MIVVVALGEVLIDFASCCADNSGYPLMQALHGGAPANFLGVLSKSGKTTAFLGKVCDDAVFTTLAFVTFDESGSHSFSFDRRFGTDPARAGRKWTNERRSSILAR